MMTSGSIERERSEPLPSPLEEAGSRPTWKAVYTIADRGNGRRYWLRIGTAFVNRDESLNVRLDAVPVNGQIHIRDAPVRDGNGGKAPGAYDEAGERGRDGYRDFPG